MTWIDAAPTVLAAALFLAVTGVPVCYALGLRGTAAWTAAPVIPPAVLGLAALIASKLGIAWSPLVAVAAIGVATAGAFAGSWALGRRSGQQPRPEGLDVRLACAAGLSVALALGTVIIVRGLGAPDSLSWTWDTTFHYSALAHVLESHDGSSLTLGALGDPGATIRFYPGGWFDIASIVAMSAGASIPVAANATAVTIAVLVWPLGCLFLARQVFGRSAAAQVLTGGLCMAFGAFPWELFYWGALWPYSLGQALVPAGLGLVLSVTGLARENAVGRSPATVLLVLAIIGIGLAHPAAVFALTVLAVFPAGWVLGRWVLSQHREGRTTRAIITVSGLVAAISVAFVGISLTPMIQGMKNDAFWPPFITAPGAVGEFLLNGTNGHRALWMLSVVMIVGAVITYRTTGARWILAAHLVVGALYVMSASVQSPTTMWLTAFWFSDSHRLAALLPTTGTVLAVFGVITLVRWVRSWAEKASLRPQLGSIAVAGPAVLVSIALVVLTKGFYGGQHTLTLSYLHRTSTEVTMKLDFYNRIKDRIPADAVVANNPEDASPLMWSLFERRVLFPHIKGSGNPKQEFLANHLHSVTSDPRVCEAAQEMHVRYLLIDPVPERRKVYPGLLDPGRTPGFELVESNGVMKLYRITACGPNRGANTRTTPTGR